jgi:prepilin signal peptidase PulO-like enzyme (type II secretory pathway)
VVLIHSFVAILGLALGSFLGACVYRIPRGISVVRPGSFCPHCQFKLQWRDLVPVLSPMLNGGRCMHCRGKISGKYSTVELTTALTLVLAVIISDWDAMLISRCAFLLTIIPLIWIDWEFFIIPNGILVIGTVAVVLAHLVLTPSVFISHVASGAAALAMMLAIRSIGTIAFRKPSLGMGDVKLSGLVALQLGFTAFLMALWFGAFCALVYLLASKERKLAGFAVSAESGSIRATGEIVPFGSFLGAAAIIILLVQDKLEAVLSLWLISIS